MVHPLQSEAGKPSLVIDLSSYIRYVHVNFLNIEELIIV